MELLITAHRKAQGAAIVADCRFSADKVRVSPVSLQPMNLREYEVMRELLGFERCNADSGARPMDVGGTDGSFHSGLLRRMAFKGWLENVGYGVSTPRGRSRRVCKYKSTEAGRKALAEATEQAREDAKPRDAARYAVRGDM